MATTKEKLEVLKKLHAQEEALYAERNEKYGDSFSKTYAKRGPTALIIRLEDKLSRADYLLSNGLMSSDGESVIDTLMDLANYANMGIMELTTHPVEGTPEAPTPKKKKRSRKKDRTDKGEVEAPAEEPTPKKKKVRKAETSEPQPEPKEEPKEKGPFDDLSKSQLRDIILTLGGELNSKKINREKLCEMLAKYPKAKVAVAITSLKSQEPTEGDSDGDKE